MTSRQRSSPEQFAIIVEFMERHGDLARPQQGPQGRIRSERLWRELAETLNSIGGGVNKPIEKWKKVWADWKTKTKTKAVQIRRSRTGTGGGQHCRVSLTDLEERVLAIIGPAAVEGQAGVEEQGFGSQLQSDRPEETAASQVSGQSSQNSSIVLEVEVEVPRRPNIDIEEAVPLPTRLALPEVPPRPATPPPGPSAQAPALPSAPAAAPPSAPTNTQGRRSVRRPHTPTAESPPSSTATTPRRRHTAARRRRLQMTPFERACSEFAAVEQRRLQREEAQERRFHERETERLRLEAQRLEVERQHNQLLNRLADVAQMIVEILSKTS